MPDPDPSWTTAPPLASDGDRDLVAAVLDTVANLVVVLDRAGRIVRFNAACERVTGYALAEVVGRSVFEVFVPAQELPAVRGVFERLRAGDFPNRHVNRWRMKDGSERLLEWANTCTVDERGEVRYVVGTATDVTERVRDAQALREAHERLRIHVETMPLALVEWDAEFRVRRLSRRAEQLFGWSAAEVVGRRIDEIPWVPEEDWPSVRAVMRDMASGARPANVNANRNVRKDGTVIHCEWYNTTLQDDEGRLQSVLSLVLDVTARQQAEEALREADRRKNEFLAVLSHELRNPLAPIRNSVHVLERVAPDSEPAVRAREVVRRQAEHLARIVDDLLDLTRISRGKIVLERARLDLRELVVKAAEDQRSLFEQAGIALRLDPGPAPIWVEADRTRLAQVLGNLLQNAVKFTEPGGRVEVAVAEAAGRAELSVLDDGIGMDPEALGRIFEPFVQADLTPSRASTGLGLGLALVKSLVELHGGAVEARSAGPGRGAEFLVRLPVAASAEGPSSEAPGAARPAGRVVLVIDDHEDAGQSLVDLLALEGHETRLALDGEAGIALARDLHPEVVFCDIGLPGMDGYEVARAFRRDEALRGIRLVALSGYAQPEDRRRAREAGFDAHLAKPPAVEELLALLGPAPRPG